MLFGLRVGQPGRGFTFYCFGHLEVFHNLEVDCLRIDRFSVTEHQRVSSLLCHEFFNLEIFILFFVYNFGDCGLMSAAPVLEVVRSRGIAVLPWRYLPSNLLYGAIAR